MKRRISCWISREWLQHGRIRREKREGNSLARVKQGDVWVVQWVDGDGRRSLRKIEEPGRPGLEKALALRSQIEEALRNGGYDPARWRKQRLQSAPVGTTWSDFRARFERNHFVELREATIKLYKQSLDVFERLCIPGMLTDITTAVIADFRAAMVDEGIGIESVKRHLRGVRVAIRKALEWELIDRAPRFPKLGSSANESRPLSDEHMKALYDAFSLPAVDGGPRYPAAADQPYSASAWWQAVLVLGCFCGLRRTEWLLLRWREVSLDRGVIHLSAERSKSGKAATIPLHPIVVQHLRRLSDFGEYVLPFERDYLGRNRPLSLQILYGEWKRLQKVAGIEEPYTFHNMRDTCLSRFAGSMTQSQLVLFSRHADFETTSKHYLHSPTVLADSIEKIPVPDFLRT